jgi:hypothetical protein
MLMKTGDVVAIVATPIARLLNLDCVDPTTNSLYFNSGCAKMQNDFNNARYLRDYGNTVLDRIRKRGKYAEGK